uniref:Uncharacterized protein n=1 Tax=Candidatus Methanogaster sp. ANME-2c ERB4 TaxID=2759911 RepID=A0A7G9Y7Q3_9EURY|nr:hypothetical protein FAIOLEIP_00007 [Methanosarcinales archaeon ANME-2c ERB4]QNO43434.1 hypothetical protein MJEPJOLK_00008 [Methanosarcinales archaeon ANME-2c ERB4]QNO44037.1 hypothetical protein JGGIPCKB_00010 [Methanosarcinales archaeon ANME-2c ERB4]
MEWKKGVISGIIAGIPDRLMNDMDGGPLYQQ